MIRQIGFGALAVIVGIVVGMIVMMLLHLASTVVYPLPEGVDFMSQDAENQQKLEEWFRALPPTAFLLATLCHGLGCMTGAVVATIVSGRRSWIPAIIVGIFFTIGGIMNLSSVPHPSWFPYIDIPVYLPLALLAAHLSRKK